MVDEDTREEWAKYATPNDEWQSTHKKNSITQITEHADKIWQAVNMLNGLNGIDTEDLQTTLMKVLDGSEEISKAIQEVKGMVAQAVDAESEAELEHIQGILESI